MMKDNKVVVYFNEILGIELKGDWFEKMLNDDKGDF